MEYKEYPYKEMTLSPKKTKSTPSQLFISDIIKRISANFVIINECELFYEQL